MVSASTAPQRMGLAFILLFLPVFSSALRAQQRTPGPIPNYGSAGQGQSDYTQPPASGQDQFENNDSPQPDPVLDDLPETNSGPTSGAASQAQPFAAEQLEQLVAPIALYPDGLVAQVLAASTYPAEVAAAAQWRIAQGNSSADQVAWGATGRSDWDPSVKALTAFPQVLAMMARDLRWTTDLGNAYFNQPQDVLQTIQVMRQRAESAGSLRNSPQEQVSDNQGYIQLAPQNPDLVYVPAYNPWAVYGDPVTPYPGFAFAEALGAVGSFFETGLHFSAGVGLAAFNNTPFGWAGWALNWLASSIFFHDSPYYSNSMSVARWGGGYRRGEYGHGEWGHGGYGRSGYGGSRNGYGGSAGSGYRNGSNNGLGGINRRPPGFGREQSAYNRPEPRMPLNNHWQGQTQPVFPRPQPRVNGYIGGGNGASFYSNTHSGYGMRRSSPYRVPESPRMPLYSAAPRSGFENRADSSPRNYAFNRGGESFRSPRNFSQHSGGFHSFSGGRSEPHFSYHAPKAPKMSGGGGHHSGGGGHFGHRGR